MASTSPARLWTTIFGAPVVPDVSIAHSVSNGCPSSGGSRDSGPGTATSRSAGRLG